MTATGASSNYFQDILDFFTAKANNGGPTFDALQRGLATGVTGSGLPSATVGRAQAFAQGAGNLIGKGARAFTNPVMTGILGGVPAALEGDYARAFGNAAGNAGGSVLAQMAVNAIPNPFLKTIAAVAIPTITGAVGGDIARGIAGSAGKTMGALGQGSQNTVVNATDPNSALNTTERSIENQLDLYNKMKEMFGEQVAQTMMQQNNAFALANKYAKDKALLAVETMPAYSARDLAEINAKAAANIINTAVSKTGDLYANAIAYDPYGAGVAAPRNL